MRRFAVSTLVAVEDAIYVLLAVMLSLAAVWVLVSLFSGLVINQSIETGVVLILDRLLLILMLVELLHTILLFLRTHHFRHEPFLIIGIIAAVRRILILTAQQSTHPVGSINSYLLELGVTTLIILVLAIALKLTPSSRSF